MLGETDKDFYCSVQAYENGKCATGMICDKCNFIRRKYPTPEQFKEEYGEEWTGAVYVICHKTDCTIGRRIIGSCLWFPNQITIPKECRDSTLICACTPFAAPPTGWRPE